MSLSDINNRIEELLEIQKTRVLTSKEKDELQELYSEKKELEIVEEQERKQNMSNAQRQELMEKNKNKKPKKKDSFVR